MLSRSTEAPSGNANGLCAVLVWQLRHDSKSAALSHYPSIFVGRKSRDGQEEQAAFRSGGRELYA